MKRHAYAALICLAFVSTFAVTAAEKPAEKQECSSTAAECDREIRQIMAGRRFLGLTISDLLPGIIVQAVVRDSPAARAGFRAGDKLIAVNGRSLIKSRVGDFKQIIADPSHNGRMRMVVLRRGIFRNIEVRLEPYTKEQLDKIVAAHLARSHTQSAAAGSPP
jgi:predicted metalloprotease with PDZ domain